MNIDPLQQLLAIRTLHQQMEAAYGNSQFGSYGAIPLASATIGLVGSGTGDSTRLVQVGGTDFFGATGAVLAMMGGLAVPGVNGMPVPMFTSDLGIGGVDPSLTLAQRANAAANHAMFQGMSGQAIGVFSGAANALMSPRGIIGSQAYMRDENGNYVNPGLASFVDMARGFANGPWGAMLTSPLFQKVLGYDVGAAAGVIQQRIGNMVTGGYDPFNPEESMSIVNDDLNERRRIVATGLHGAVMRASHKASGVKNYENTFGLSDETMGEIASDMYQIGAFDDTDFDSGMTSEDNDRRERINRNLDEIDDRTRRINRAKRELERLQREGIKSPEDDAQVKRLSRNIKRWEREVVEIGADNDSIRDEMGSFNWWAHGVDSVDDVFGAIDKAKKDADEKAKKVAAAKDNLDFAVSNSSDAPSESENIDKLTAEFEAATREANEAAEKAKQMEQAAGALVAEKGRAVASLVETMKNLYGSERAGLQALRGLVGNAYADPSVAASVDAGMMALQGFAHQNGISSAVTKAMIGESSGLAAFGLAGKASSEGFGVSYLSASLGMQAAGNEQLAIAGKTGIEAKRAAAAARWETENRSKGTFRKFAVLLESARENGNITQEQYEQYKAMLASGSNMVMDRAAHLLGTAVFGSDARTAEMLSNPAFVERIANDLTKEGSDNVNDLESAAAHTELMESADVAAADMRYGRAYSALRKAGIGGRRIRQARDSAEFDKVSEKLDGSSSPADRALSREFKARYNNLRQKYIDQGMSEEEANARARSGAMKYFNANLRGRVSPELSRGFDKDVKNAGAEAVKKFGDSAKSFVEADSFIKAVRDLGDGSISKDELREYRKRLVAAKRSGNGEAAAAIAQEIRDRLTDGGANAESLAAVISNANARIDEIMGAVEGATKEGDGTDLDTAAADASAAGGSPQGAERIRDVRDGHTVDENGNVVDRTEWKPPKDTAEFVKRQRELMREKGGDPESAVERMLDAFAEGDVQKGMEALFNKDADKAEIWKKLAGSEGMGVLGDLLKEHNIVGDQAAIFTREFLDANIKDENYVKAREEARKMEEAEGGPEKTGSDKDKPAAAAPLNSDLKDLLNKIIAFLKSLVEKPEENMQKMPGDNIHL